MKYQVGKPGRMIVARFEHGEDILAGLSEIASRENIRSAVFHLVGAMGGGRFVAGPEESEMPPVPVWRNISEPHEVLASGTIFWHENVPAIHCHGAFGRGEDVSAGCLREATKTFLVLEAVIVEMIGINAERELDKLSGMVLLKL